MALRLGLVGRGRWGRNIERTLLSFPDVSVTTIAKGESPPAGLDGVLIATQSTTHAQAALPYIEAGVATFIEKPITTTVSDAERIREAAQRSGGVVFVGDIFLHHPAFLAALELLPSLGAIRYLLCEGMNGSPRTDSSVLWDWLPHDLSMARAILGRGPDSVAAWSLSGGLTPGAAVSKFQFGTTPVVSTVSWLSAVRRKQTIMVCENAALVFDDKAERQLALYTNQPDLSVPAYSNELPLTLELRAFLQAIRSGTADASHIESGMVIVRAIAAAEESISLGGGAVKI
jgi:UDP-N-acetylglucosamine 3-dehydrogenase